MFPDIDLILNSAISLGIVLAPIELYLVHLVRPLVAKLSNPQQLIKEFFKIGKMNELSAKGVAARQLNQEIIGAIASVDPLKAFAIPAIEEAVSERFGKAYGSMVGPMISQVPMNFTQMAVDVLSTKFPQISEQLKALKVITNAEKVA